MAADSPSEPRAWSYESHRRHQVRRGLELTPAERLRWLETTLEQMRSLVGRAAEAEAALEPEPDPPD